MGRSTDCLEGLLVGLLICWRVGEMDVEIADWMASRLAVESVVGRAVGCMVEQKVAEWGLRWVAMRAGDY